MDEGDWLIERFEANRAHLRAVAYRMLGSLSDADDAVQEVWLRLSRSDTSGVENLSGWLTTVVARVCLDMLRSRESRREELRGAHVPDPIVSREARLDPEQQALMAESVGLALLVVLETLTPAERLAFVLHDMFAMPFDDIAPIVGRSSAAARQLASRAGHVVASKEQRPSPTPIPPAGAESSTPSSPPHAAVTSTRFSLCSTRTSCSQPIPQPWTRVPRASCAVRRPWPPPSLGVPDSHNRRSSTERREPCGLQADSRASCSPSRSRAARSPRSRSWPTPSDSAN